MYKEIYALQADKDKLLEDLIKVRTAYKSVTGKEYDEDNQSESGNTSSDNDTGSD